jgi:hypothetical protein
MLQKNIVTCDKHTQTETEKLKCNLFEIMHITKLFDSNNDNNNKNIIKKKIIIKIKNKK